MRIVLLALICCALRAADPHAAWLDFNGAPDAAQYSSLTQISRSNVSKLRVAWTYASGDNFKLSFNPVIANGAMYVLAKDNVIVALNAQTGGVLWRHPTDPRTTLITRRGINYWQSADGADRRLLFACNNLLEALDARTGKTIPSFGRDGYIDLREGFGRDPKTLTQVQSLSPGRVFENLLILGSATNQGYGSAPGDLRAFDIPTGKLVWTFHTIPHPGELGYETWPKDAWQRGGGANAWSEISVDARRGIVYVPTASPKYNFYGADRKGANLFGDCLLALDARTGKRLWHFQMVHHDIWDYDNGTAPKLLTVKHDGKSVDVVAQVGKEGFVWVFDRVTGKPLWPIEERAVPQTAMPGEQTWPTQPFPTQPPPFARQRFTAADLSPYLDAGEKTRFRRELESARNEGLFTPPGLHNTVEMPGNNGGANWGGAAVDSANGTLYVVSKDLPAMLKLERNDPQKLAAGSSPVDTGAALYRQNCRACHGVDLRGQPPIVPSLLAIRERLRKDQIISTIQGGQGSMPAFAELTQTELNYLIAFLDHPNVAARVQAHNATASSTAQPPASHYFSGFGFMIASSGLSPIAPPWTSLTAYDLNRGTIKWKVPLGDVPELAAKGIRNTGVHFPKFGPVVTAGGLIFTASRDRKVRALDERTGKILWETEAPAGMEGIPAVYEAGGREYLVVCASAQSCACTESSTEIHGAYIAFALP